MECYRNLLDKPAGAQYDGAMNDSLGVLALVLAIFVLPVILQVSGACSSPDRAKSTLEAAGFTDVQAGGYDYFACGKGDTFSTHFSAKNAQGHTVEGTVCCGWLKSCTVRF